MAEGKDLIHEAWHPVNRIDAEKLLSGKDLGSYLFRKDEYATLLEDQLNSYAGEGVVCLTLTYLETLDHVVDRTIVYKDGNWYFYDDDPKLETNSYPTVEEVLDHSGALRARGVHKKAA